MISRTAFINTAHLKQVNKALRAAGYSEYPGDRTTAYPDDQGGGYVSNLLAYLAAGDAKAQKRILYIVNGVLS